MLVSASRRCVCVMPVDSCSSNQLCYPNFCRMDPTRAAAVAAASASAVADAGPAAAAAAGAAAAAAVTAALSEAIELSPYHSSEMTMYIVEGDSLSNGLGIQESGLDPFSIDGALPMTPKANLPNMKFKSMSEEQVSKLKKPKLLLRRWGSFDLALDGRSPGPRKPNGRLIKSESELSIAGSVDGRLRHVARALSFRSDSGSNDSSVEDSSSIEAPGGGQTVYQTKEASSLESCNLNKCRSVDSGSEQDASIRDANLLESPIVDESVNSSIVHSKSEREAFLASRFSGYRGSHSSMDVPQRILSLLPSATEILMDIGELVCHSLRSAEVSLLLLWPIYNSLSVCLTVMLLCLTLCWPNLQV